MDSISLFELHERHIKDTLEKTYVAEVTILLCDLTKEVFEACKFEAPRVYISSKCVKHLYDSKPAEEYDSILKHIESIVRFPDHIYKNKPGKKGHLCFVKSIKKKRYFCSIEKNISSNENPNLEITNFVVTCFRLRDREYLKSYQLLWSWKGDNPSS